MRPAAMPFATIALLAAFGASGMRPAALAQPSNNPRAAVEARHAFAQATAEAARARDRAAELDRQARNALAAGERANLTAASLAARVQQLEAKIAAAQAQLALVREARARLAARLARESVPVNRLLAGLQTQLHRPAALQLMQPGSLTDAVHLRAVVVAIEPQILSKTAALRQELARQRGFERKAASIAARYQILWEQLQARREELAAVSAAQRLKADRASSAADREAERAFALGQNARDISTLIRRLEAGATRVAGPVKAPSVLPQPASGADRFAPHRLPVDGFVAGGRPSNRKGLTLVPRPGAVVVAPGAGRVAYAGPFRGYGSIVILEHGGRWTSLVTGLAATQVAVGQTIAAGYPLGRAAAVDALVTVEVRRNGIPVEPFGRLR
jgi:murein hydrolase activator